MKSEGIGEWGLSNVAKRLAVLSERRGGRLTAFLF